MTNAAGVYTTEQEIDGESFLELSSRDDFEHILQITYTYGIKTKLKKLMAAISASPSGRFI